MKKFYVTLLMFALCTFQLTAFAEISWIKAVSSPELFRQYCLEHIAYASLGVSSQSALPNQTGSIWRPIPDPKMLNEFIRGEVLTYTTMDPNSAVYLYVNLCDQNGYSLFYGYKETKLVLIDDVWKVADGHVELDVVNGVTPLNTGKKIATAYAQMMDSSGNVTNYVNMHVDQSQNGIMFFPTGLVGKHARLIIGEYDPSGQIVYSGYDVATGTKIQTIDVPCNTEVSLVGIKELLQGDIALLVPSTNHVTAAMPSVKMIIKTNNFSVNVDVKTTEGERPTAVYMREWGQEKVYTINLESQETTIDLIPGGTWFFWFEWPTLTEPEKPVYDPYLYGGKG